MPGIYLHIPFCKQACSYCDFYFSTSLGNQQTVVSAIAKEIALRHSYTGNNILKSIYFGGGTPSLLSNADLQLLFATMGSYFTWDNHAEITLEVNPDDISAATLKNWRALGINRLSIGLQSFNDEELRWMNRAHTAAQSISSVRMAQEAGFDNISIDLIYGSKFQTLSSWEKTLEKAIRLNTQHISSYNLTIENKTVLGLKNQRGQEPSVDDELSSKQFLLMLSSLESCGFVQYEISNFGKPGCFAVHNSNYWLQKSYLGVGRSAHSFDGISRQWNLKNNIGYAKALESGDSFFEKEMLSLSDRYNEYVLTRLRTLWGCDPKEIGELFGEKILNHFTEQLAAFHEFVEVKDGLILLNKEGRLRADGIASDLFLL